MSMLKIRVNDEVMVRIGKDAGQKGKVEKVFTKKDKALVSGVNVYKKHSKRSLTGRAGAIIEGSRPIVISKLALICPNCKKPTRVGFKINGDKKVRACKKCRKEI